MRRNGRQRIRGALVPRTSASVVPVPITRIHSIQTGSCEETLAFPRAEDAFYPKESAPDSVSTLQIYKGVIPFVAIQVLGLVILSIFPALTTWLPKVIFG